MGSFSSIPTTAAFIVASRGVRGGGASLGSYDEKNLIKAIIALVGLPTLALSWVILTCFIGKPEHSITDVGTIVTIDSRKYKSTYYYEVTTSKGYTLDFYRYQPEIGEYVYKDVTQRKFQREVIFTKRSGGITGYTQIWPFMKK